MLERPPYSVTCLCVSERVAQLYDVVILRHSIHIRSLHWKAGLQGCLVALAIWLTPRHSATGEGVRKSAKLRKGGLHSTQLVQHL
jgi:hypothetical protein